jgi:hypothetical protein
MQYPTESRNSQAKKKYGLKKDNEYLSTIKAKDKDGIVAMGYTVTTEKSEALKLCTKAAALAMLCVIESHMETKFEVCVFND